jgi:type II secretory pathway component GspD/PulD (secretin)
LTALNHEEASILIGSKYGYRTTFTSTTGTMQNINFLEVGTKLRFIPHITEDGYIVMEIYPSVSDGSVKNDIPQEDTTETRNKVLVKDGQSILIGGLTKNYTSQVDIGVPILSSIPFIGSLFRRTEILSQKMELMVIITPHIVTPQFIEAMAQRAKDMDTQRQQWNEKAKLVR